MIRKKTINAILMDKKRELDKLDKTYVNYLIGDKEYGEKRPKLLGKIEQLEELLNGSWKRN